MYDVCIIKVIFKGDANYRRMLGDRKWDIHTPLTAILHPWAPTNLIALRTLKFSVEATIHQKIRFKMQNLFLKD